MCGCRVMAIVILVTSARPAGGQLLGKNIEVVATSALIGGASRLDSDVGARTFPYGGVRLDAGFQFARTSLGLGGRLWALDGGSELAGVGIDGFALATYRLPGSIHTAVRAALGVSFEALDPAEDRNGARSTQDGLSGSLGAEHEVFIFSRRFVVSVEMLVPPPRTTFGRKTPVLEFGFGFRERIFHPISPI